LERNDAGAGIVMRNVGVTRQDTGDFKLHVLERMERIEKLLETINLRLAASPWRPGGGGEVR
jgi:hypothetical protein